MLLAPVSDRASERRGPGDGDRRRRHARRGAQGGGRARRVGHPRARHRPVHREAARRRHHHGERQADGRARRCRRGPLPGGCVPALRGRAPTLVCVDACVSEVGGGAGCRWFVASVPVLSVRISVCGALIFLFVCVCALREDNPVLVQFDAVW